MSDLGLINKITSGYVVQTYDPKQHKYISQRFVPTDTVSYEYFDGITGMPVSCDTVHHLSSEFEKHGSYLPFDMIQPD